MPPHLNRPQDAHAYFSRLFAEPAEHAAWRDAQGLLPRRRWLERGQHCQTAGTAMDAARLNAPLAAAEIEHAIRRLQTGVAPGLLGIPNEFIKYARFRPMLLTGRRGDFQYVLPAALAALFNGCMAAGSVPEGWLVTAVRPLPKVAAPQSWDDLRAIAVGSSVPKLFAAVLNRRLVDWAEHGGKHAPEQAGFRPRLSTTHHLFALRHVVDWHRAAGAPLYLAFVDFRKAYDSVNRNLLWLKLEHLGVRGRFLAALQSLYAGDSAFVQLDGCQSAKFGPARRFLWGGGSARSHRAAVRPARAAAARTHVQVPGHNSRLHARLQRRAVSTRRGWRAGPARHVRPVRAGRPMGLAGPAAAALRHAGRAGVGLRRGSVGATGGSSDDGGRAAAGRGARRTGGAAGRAGASAATAAAGGAVAPWYHAGRR